MFRSHAIKLPGWSEGAGFDAKQLNPADYGDGAIPDTKDTIKGSRCEPYLDWLNRESRALLSDAFNFFPTGGTVRDGDRVYHFGEAIESGSASRGQV